MPHHNKTMWRTGLLLLGLLNLALAIEYTVRSRSDRRQTYQDYLKTVVQMLGG